MNKERDGDGSPVRHPGAIHAENEPCSLGAGCASHQPVIRSTAPTAWHKADRWLNATRHSVTGRSRQSGTA